MRKKKHQWQKHREKNVTCSQHLLSSHFCVNYSPPNRARLSFTKGTLLPRPCVNPPVIENTLLINELKRLSKVWCGDKVNSGHNWGAFLIWVNGMKRRETEMSAGRGETRPNETQHVFVKHAWKRICICGTLVVVAIPGKSNNAAKFNWNADSRGTATGKRQARRRLCVILEQFCKTDAACFF